jgi:hypothetical protein
MSIRVHCPFDNTSIVLANHPPTGRTVCPRCGETFVIRDAEEIDERLTDSVATHQYQRGVDTPSSDDRFPSLKALLVSCVIALLILGFGLYVYQPFGQAPPTQPPDTRPPGTIPPAALAGLRYLPAGANIVFAVQPAPLLAYAERTNTDPYALLAASGVPADVTGTLNQIGLPLDQIDHLVGGVTLTATELFPGVAFVLKLRRPIADETAFLTALGAQKKPKAGPPVYSVTAGLPLTLMKLDERTYLFGLSENDLSGANAPPEPLLPSELRAGLARLSPASFVWIATDNVRWADTTAAKLLAQAAKDPAAKDRSARLAQLRQLVAGVSLEPDPRLMVAVRTADAETAERLREYFSERLDAAVVSGEGDWAAADSPFNPAAGPGPVGKLLEDVW